MREKVYTIDIAAPVDRVWQEITRTNTRCRPMYGTMLLVKLEPGAPLRYRSMDGKFTFVAGEVVEVKAPTRLVHTFVFPNLPDPPTLVTWELTAIPSGTRLTVTHSRFDGETKTYKSIDGGWPKILRLFKREIETGDVGAGEKFLQGLMSVVCFLLPKTLRTEVVEAAIAKRPLRIP
jgi:uncharacterized protein YndB with AHSA1/START domain